MHRFEIWLIIERLHECLGMKYCDKCQPSIYDRLFAGIRDPVLLALAARFEPAVAVLRVDRRWTWKMLEI